MKSRVLTLTILIAFAAIGSAGCATKKFVRARVNERVTPLENRTGELEETSRRNSQDISRLNDAVTEVRGRADRAQTQADTALTRAEEASNRAGAAEHSVGELRANLDNYSLQNTATVNFAFDSFELSPEAKAALDRVAEQIRDRSNFILEIEGFADAKGRDTYNNQLTDKRAAAVRRYLAERHNIALFRMHVLGLGSLRAVADNSTPEGRALNRRVEIRLLTRNVAGGAATTTSRAGQRQN
ncbi:MAG TPA: OmpA family protein [Blastocatellia bacterium]|nr:OmpA family protein [Blastocatellia bacterium]